MLHPILLLQVTLQLRSLLILLPQLILHLLLQVILAFRVCWILSWLFKRLMVSFWWMCSWSFRHCEQIWRAFNDLLHHLLLMMSLDYPSAIRHKKGEYIWMEIGGDFVFLELWSFRLYLGASWCIFFFFFWLIMYLSWCIYFYGMYMLGEDIMFFYLFYCMCYIDYWFILWGFSWYVFYFSVLWNQKFILVLLVFSTHVFLYLLSVIGIYKLISHATIYTGN